MDTQINSMIGHIAKSHREMVRILEAKRYVTAHMAAMVGIIPDAGLPFTEMELLLQNCLGVTRCVTGYLNCLAALEDALAENLAIVLKELKVQPDPPDEE